MMFFSVNGFVLDLSMALREEMRNNINGSIHVSKKEYLKNFGNY